MYIRQRDTKRKHPPPMNRYTSIHTHIVHVCTSDRETHRGTPQHTHMHRYSIHTHTYNIYTYTENVETGPVSY